MRNKSFGLPTLYPVMAAGFITAFGLGVWSSERYAPWFATPGTWISLALAVTAFGYEFGRDRVTAARVVLVLALLGA
jgi:hypothetical protein